MTTRRSEDLAASVPGECAAVSAHHRAGVGSQRHPVERLAHEWSSKFRVVPFAGAIIAFGTQIQNGSNDSAVFEMSYGGLTALSPNRNN